MHKKLLCALGALILCPTIVFADAGEYDLTEKSNVTQGQLSQSVYHDLKGLAPVFVECEEEYGVNSVLLASIAAIESGWGRSELAESKSNIFGWRSATGSYSEFENKAECIKYVAKSIHENYLCKVGKYYSGGTTVEDISEIYSESEDWTDAVCGIADGIQERCDNCENKDYGMYCPG